MSEHGIAATGLLQGLWESVIVGVQCEKSDTVSKLSEVARYSTCLEIAFQAAVAASGQGCAVQPLSLDGAMLMAFLPRLPIQPHLRNHSHYCSHIVAPLLALWAPEMCTNVNCCTD